MEKHLLVILKVSKHTFASFMHEVHARIPTTAGNSAPDTAIPELELLDLALGKGSHLPRVCWSRLRSTGGAPHKSEGCIGKASGTW